MIDFIRRLFDTDFMPHVACLRDLSVVRMHYLSDLVIGLAYYTIPLALVYFVRKRRDIAFSYVFLWFGAFIFACGTTHVMSVVTLWNPMYRIEGIVKVFTAVVSLYTAFLLWPLMPKALALPSPAQLAEANQQLAIEVNERKDAENAVRRLNLELEERVRVRTAELTQSNKELQERTAEMEQFTYTVSHDLKSPLVTVQGFAGLIEEDLSAGRMDRLVECAHEIKSAGRHMAELISDLLELTRIGRIVTRIESVPLTDAARAVLEEHRIQLEGKNVQVQVEDDMPVIQADAGHIRQVFDNLVLNAIKYGTDTPSPCLEIGATRSGGIIQVFVRDNGVGIPEAYHEKVFELFQRLRADQEGTGVGLAIVKRVVEFYGGKAWVESRQGEGATFWVTFPASA